MSTEPRQGARDKKKRGSQKPSRARKPAVELDAADQGSAGAPRRASRRAKARPARADEASAVRDSESDQVEPDQVEPTLAGGDGAAEPNDGDELETGADAGGEPRGDADLAADDEPRDDAELGAHDEPRDGDEIREERDEPGDDDDDGGEPHEGEDAGGETTDPGADDGSKGDPEDTLVDVIPDDLRDLPDDDEPTIPGSDTALRPGLEKARPGSVSEAHLKSVLESLVFVSDKPVPAKRLAKIARAKSKDVERLLAELAQEYAGRGIELVEIAGGYQFRSTAANAPFVREIVQAKPVRLSRAQLETLAIAAYRQPLTRPELEEIRGVDSGSALKVLLERGLVKILGRKDEPGRPLLYGTTPQFLELFGMSSLDQLPTLKEFSELSDESRALFARKTGEEIGTIGDITLPETHWEADDEDDEGESDAEARDEGHQPDDAEARAASGITEDAIADEDEDRDSDDDDSDDDDSDDDDSDDDDSDDDDSDDDDSDDDDSDDDDSDDDDSDDDDDE